MSALCYDAALFGQEFRNSMHKPLTTNLDARGMRIGIAVSRYHSDITDSMRDAAVDTFVRAGGTQDQLVIVPAPGAFELPALCRALANQETRSGKPCFDAAVAIGCLIAGETTHDQYLAEAVTQGFALITSETGMPIAFGILTCQNIQQARARSIEAAKSGGVNKGAEAMAAAIETVHAIASIESARGSR